MKKGRLSGLPFLSESPAYFAALAADAFFTDFAFFFLAFFALEAGLPDAAAAMAGAAEGAAAVAAMPLAAKEEMENKPATRAAIRFFIVCPSLVLSTG
jgi:hypothetical protein